MRPEPITVFEFDSLYLDRGEKKLTPDQFKALLLYNPNNKLPYYRLLHKGVQFREYVGVIQIGKTVIEVLPKADKYSKDDWRKILINVLKVVNSFEVKDTSSSSLKIKPNSVLDLYFEKFINEVEYLYHNGLIKKYRKAEGNLYSLKGNLLFGKHIQKNLTHQERFYVKYNSYDIVHTLHIIIYKAIKILKQINTNVDLESKIGALELLFPEMPDIKVSERLFDKIVYNRKTIIYKNAIEIAKLLLLRYHPDLISGRNYVLALMFDMNLLWEKFVYISLRKKLEGHKVTAQTRKTFWIPDKGYKSTIRADILIKNGDNTIVLDTKWKNINGRNPSSEDLKQMFVYHKYYNAKKVALVYPGNWGSVQGVYDYMSEKNNCSLIALNVEDKIKIWQESISKKIGEWINYN